MYEMQLMAWVSVPSPTVERRQCQISPPHISKNVLGRNLGPVLYED